MSNSEYREAQQQARDHGLRARQEARLENATYTAAEVKVLTAKARQETAEEIAGAIEAERADVETGIWDEGEAPQTMVASEVSLQWAARKAREIGSREPS